MDGRLSQITVTGAKEAAQLLEPVDQRVVVVAARLGVEAQQGLRPVGLEAAHPAMDARFQWPRCRRIGTRRPGAPHRRDQRDARLVEEAEPRARFSAPVDPEPLLLTSGGDLCLVALDGAARGPCGLQPSAHS